MAADGIFFLFPSSLGAKDGRNVLWLKLFGYSDVTGITFVCLRQFQKLAWRGRDLLCLAPIDRQSVAIQEGLARRPQLGSFLATLQKEWR